MTLYAVNRNAGEAVYLQIARSLRQEIKSNYDAGDFLPTENELAARFSVNRHTIRHAIDELVTEELLERQHGRGTVVLDTLFDYRIGEQTRFTETFSSLGKITGTSIIRKVVIPALGGVARRLEVELNTPVLMIETLRYVDEQPFCIISHFLPIQSFPSIETDYHSGSLHGFIQKHFNVSIVRKESLMTATLPMGEDASHLQIPRTFPILRVKSINIDAHTHKPVEYALTRFRADRVQLSFAP